MSNCELAVELSGVSLSFGNRLVLDGVDFRMERRDYVAIVGANGSGKTSLLRLIVGLLKPDAGTVRVFGRTPGEVKGVVGYVPQRSRFEPQFPIRVLDVVAMGRLASARWGGLRGSDRDASLQALTRVDMEGFAFRSIGTLSGGELQRVLIARALAQRPRVLLLDEPTASLDERIGRTVWELFEELSREMAVVVVSHDIGAVSRSVRSVACLNRRLNRHLPEELTPAILEGIYGGPIELLVHGHAPMRSQRPREEVERGDGQR
jgi:zinc transport system ATP-binding protein